jgi:L-methionine (R)-S-oxide reductase
MSESLYFTTEAENRTARYSELIPQLKALLENENDTIVLYANIAAALKETFDFFWVGFYRVQENQLVLGPFQGPIACTRIQKGRGVCGKAWELNQIIIVPNVDEFPGHIACSSESKSEIVLPVYNSNKEIIAVLDVDSNKYSDFSNIDQNGLSQIVAFISENVIA